MRKVTNCLLIYLTLFIPLAFANEQDITKLSEQQAGFYGTSHFGVYHNLREISTDGSSIEMQDGSVWDIEPFYQRTTMGWLPTDLITFSINIEGRSEYPFTMNNLTLIQAVSCALKSPPHPNSPLTHRIIYKDGRNVYLEDGSYWQMSLFDRKSHNLWEVNDTVIIATNNLLLYIFNPNILINAHQKNYARGFCITMK